MRQRSVIAPLLGTLLVFACTASSEDDNSDGNSETVLDATGDTIADDLGTALDLNQDGTWDQFDSNKDGVPDGIGVDTDGDGVLDALGLDTDGDGIIDALDTNGDLVPDRGTTIKPTPGSGGAGSMSSGGASGNSGGSATSSGGSTFVPGTTYGAVCETFGGQSLDTAFASLYADWKATQLVACGDTLRVQGCPSADASGTCSEAMGYGMLLAVGANDQDTFDKLNAYRKDMLSASSTPDKSLMPWAIWNAKSCPPTADGGDQNAATDADIDAALALLQARDRFGGSTYETEARTILTSLMNLTVTGSGASIKLKPGNHDNDNRDYVAYYPPGYFLVFAELTGDARWNDLASAFYTRLLANQCSGNGQIYDDFANPPNPSNPSECKFWWDSCRVPWRVSVDYAWHQNGSAKTFLDKLNGFVGADPTSVSDQKNSAFTGGAVLSAISSSDPAKMQALCTAWANADNLDDAPYFQKTLKLLYLMVAGGNFARPL